jgi:single-stranded-DNA-specific exonuclease
MLEATWTLRPCNPREAARLAQALGVSETTASVLLRRGYDTPTRAATFLAGELPGHDPFLLGSMREACERIRAAIAAGTRVCVHGDYDVDGICATALAVLVLRELGAEVEWHLPSRFEEGYGIAGQTLTRLAADGCGLVLTVDCGITAVEEVAEAKAAGLDVIVTDHHRPGAELPDCPVVATRPSAYPFPELCGTGVVFKLAEALLGPGDSRLGKHLDLVALATIADVVPLIDENRALALAGLRRLAATTRPGLRALMQAAHVDAAVVDEGAVGFRLAPRINAAGRLGRPTAALELLLTDDEEEARGIALELEELNRERQAVEERILREATAAIEAWPEPRRRRRGYVVADEGWHEGVIGIVASRLVERYHRPVVLIAGAGAGSADGEAAGARPSAAGGDWKGSGRSIPAFDLHACVAACSEHLERFGGHRAAAGLSISPENVDALAEAFAAHADAHLADDDLRPVTVVDAIVPGAALTLGLCAELRRLAPFGLGNPGVTLLVAGCELGNLTAVGEGKHLRFRVSDAAGRVAGTAIAFGLGPHLDRFHRVGHYDVAFRLQENTWNGTTSPQLVVRRIFDTPDRYVDLRERFAAEWRSKNLSPEAEQIAAELGLEPGGPWRSLLESETFRALLDDALELRRAA